MEIFQWNQTLIEVYNFELILSKDHWYANAGWLIYIKSDHTKVICLHMRILAHQVILQDNQFYYYANESVRNLSVATDKLYKQYACDERSRIK